MVQVVPGRFTARTDEPFVVFIIGMRINRPLAIRKWLPTMRAMPPMLKELYQHPEKGFLGAEFFIYRWGPSSCSTGARSRSSKGSPATPTTRTCRPGSASTARWARTGAWASSTRPLSWSAATSRRSTPTCRSSASPTPPSTFGRWADGRRRGGA
jgi:hypothetical protein